MKRIFTTMVALVATLALMTACEEDPVEPTPDKPNVENPDKPNPDTPENPDKPNPDEPEPEKPELTITVEATTPLDSYVEWSADDALLAWFIGADGSSSFAQKESSTLTLGNDPTKATATFTTIPDGGKAWLTYGSNSGYDGCSARKVEFNYSSKQTQEVAGVMNRSNLRMIGTPIAVSADNTTYTTQMNLVGTVINYRPFSQKGLYTEEKVTSVQLLSADNPIAGNGAAIAYNFADFHDTERGYKYWTDNSGSLFGDVCTIFWDGTSKSITTTLTTPMDVATSSAGMGIFMFVPGVRVGGYSVVLTTDVAIYTFNSQSSNIDFGVNKVLSLDLNLDEADGRTDLSAVKGDLQYIGDLTPTTAPLSCDGVTDRDGGYWYAQVRNTGSEAWENREGVGNEHYYTGVRFDVIDNATGATADWLTVGYRNDGTTHWWINATPNQSDVERTATVTASFVDVDGYVVTEECRSKSLVITQQAFTNTKTLGFFGGIGDQIIAGGVAENFDLGYCVITVNGVLAESWGDDRYNEQALYGNVEIVCREGAANGPVVDWLTVEYGKNGEGQFNSTHLLANATENNTGAERKALVCCTYKAPEGYLFEDGSTEAFRQFFVTQLPNTGLSMIEFWGGLAAEYTHDASAQQDWGLSWWVIKVDGTDATDWGGDKHNEQMLYGAADFKCYDYTGGTRGAEIDWLTVDYKNENGKYIDTWWLANIEANTTGAERWAEVVCTFPEMEGYTYKDDNRVKTLIIKQSAN